MGETATVAILFGRRGSVGVPGKNVTPLLGRPCAQYPLLAALHADSVRRTYVSTDDPRIAALGKKNDAVLIERPEELCRSDSPLEAAIVHAYREVLERETEPVDQVVLLLANAPYVTAEGIDRAVQMLSDREEWDSVVSVTELNQYKPARAKVIEDGVLMPAGETDTSGERGFGGDVYFGDGGFVVVRPRVLEAIEEQPGPFRWQGARVGAIEQLPNPGDIDQSWQIPGAEWWLAQNGFTRTATPYRATGRLVRRRRMERQIGNASLRRVRGKRVAVIGRAPYLADSGLGAEIDAADVVVRVNWHMPIPDDAAPHVGGRTDLLYLLGATGRREREAAAKAHGVPSMVKNRPLLQRLVRRALSSYGRRVHRKYLPNTGTICIFDCLEHGAAEVRAYGFDLHTSNNYADTGETHDSREKWERERAENRVRSHDPDIDRMLLADLQASNTRFVPDAVLSAVLEE